MSKFAIQEISTGDFLRTSSGKDESNIDTIKDGTKAVVRSLDNGGGVYRVVELVNDKISKVLPVLFKGNER